MSQFDGFATEDGYATIFAAGFPSLDAGKDFVNDFLTKNNISTQIWDANSINVGKKSPDYNIYLSLLKEKRDYGKIYYCSNCRDTKKLAVVKFASTLGV